MTSPSTPSQNAAFQHMPPAAHDVATAVQDDDVAIGWECACPSLQIESWRDAAAAKPFEAPY